MRTEAASNKPQARPAFLVEKAEGTFKKTVMKKVKGKYEPETIDAPMGWLVSIPKGKDMLDVVHIEKFEEMKRLGFDRTNIPLVDDEGEPVGQTIANKAFAKKEAA